MTTKLNWNLNMNFLTSFLFTIMLHFPFTTIVIFSHNFIISFSCNQQKWSTLKWVSYCTKHLNYYIPCYLCLFHFFVFPIFSYIFIHLQEERQPLSRNGPTTVRMLKTLIIHHHLNNTNVTEINNLLYTYFVFLNIYLAERFVLHLLSSNSYQNCKYLYLPLFSLNNVLLIISLRNKSF